jgi:hypothetical protein
MALETQTSVTHSNPSTVSVSVHDSTGPGGNSGTATVYMTVDGTEATFTGAGATTSGYSMNAASTVILWRNLPFSDRAPLTVAAEVARVTATSYCTTLDCIIDGTYAGASFTSPVEITVCFP